MRVITLNKDQATEVSNLDSAFLAPLAESAPITHKSYHELSDRPVVEADGLAQLHANIEMLTDLSGRLSFLMREVRYLMKV
ncbi:hypothetical protein ACES2L_04990 [Bdellovibrio bacteriovorus]